MKPSPRFSFLVFITHSSGENPEVCNDKRCWWNSRYYRFNKTDLIHLSVNVAGMDEESDGKNIWKDEKSTIINRELKSMVEFYKKDLVPKYDIPEL